MPTRRTITIEIEYHEGTPSHFVVDGDRIPVRGTHAAREAIRAMGKAGKRA